MNTPTADPKECVCGRTNLTYLAAGSGPRTFVLLHGWSAFKELWWSTVRALSAYGRVLAVDMPGHGTSPIGSSRSMIKVAGRVHDFCVANDVTTMTLIGHSMGGNVAVEFALAYPAMVDQLVLVAPALEGKNMPLYTRAYLQRNGGWAVLRAGMALARRLDPLAARVPHDHGGGIVRPALRRAAYWAHHDADALRGLLESMFANPLGERLHHLAMPTLVVNGEYDPLVPAALTRQMAKRIPNAKFVIIRKAAHNPMDERPQEFAQAVLAFVAPDIIQQETGS